VKHKKTELTVISLSGKLSQLVGKGELFQPMPGLIQREGGKPLRGSRVLLPDKERVTYVRTNPGSR